MMIMMMMMMLMMMSTKIERGVQNDPPYIHISFMIIGYLTLTLTLNQIKKVLWTLPKWSVPLCWMLFLYQGYS
jgi:hypothetical protein